MCVAENRAPREPAPVCVVEGPERRASRLRAARRLRACEGNVRRPVGTAVWPWLLGTWF